MSKKFGTSFIALLIVFGLLTKVSFENVRARAVLTGFKQQPQPRVLVNPRTAAVIAATTEVLRETSEIRRLEVLQPVRSGAQSRVEIERMIVRNLNEETTPEEMRATEIALKKFGLAPPGFEYQSFIVRLLTEQVAGYYDPKTKEFQLADWIDVEGQKPVIAHELVHVLQDQHFDLRRFERWPKGDSDAELAAHALIEGDATFTMMAYVMRDLSRAQAFAKIPESDSSSEQIKRAPRALRETLLFPYTQGMNYASQLFRKGGWPGLTQAFKELPQSTEQILHPEKYFAREAPTKIELANITSALGANWKRTDYDVNGEWGYYLILGEHLLTDAESKQASAGWSGDRYALYEEPKTGSVLLTHLTAWDTEQDATEFFNAYAKRTARRYNLDTSAAAGTTSHNNLRQTWRTNEGAVVVERRGMRVLILEGVPDKTNAETLLKALWQ